MAALVVTVSPASGMGDREGRIGIFPGATTTMYPADTPFWVGYGFAAESGSETGIDGSSTRFELDVDGKPASMLADVALGRWSSHGKTNVSELPAGLPVGWHELTAVGTRGATWSSRAERRSSLSTADNAPGPA